MSASCTEERFLADVKDHQMTVIKEDGVYRHVRFAKPGTGCMHFDLITWPGYLCYCGDMGTFVFARLSDMFEFFRTDRRGNDRLYINLSYWSEKLLAVDGNRHNGSALEFSEDKFRREINEYRVRWMRDAKAEELLDKNERRELWEAVEDEVIGELENGSSDSAMQAAYRFSFTRKLGDWHPKVLEWQFDDFFDHSFTEYTFHFTWCCYALAWGIKQYDAAKEASKLEEPVTV